MTTTEETKITQSDLIPSITEQLDTNLYILSDGTVLLEGYQVPYIEASKQDHFYPDRPKQVIYSVLVDNRIGYVFESRREAALAIRLGATMAALARGYNSFGPNLRPMNEFNKRPLGFLYDNLVANYIQRQGGNAWDNEKQECYQTAAGPCGSVF